MTIIFICGSLEKGRDGVGDYTRELAANLIKTQHIEITIVSLNDPHVNEISSQKQLAQNIEIDVLRLPTSLAYEKRIERLYQYTVEIKPDIISLQFVPYAFDKKGMPYKLCNWLSTLPVKNWHIMFHELWIGMEKNDSFKFKLIGTIQRYIIKKLVRKLMPKHINTSNQLYYYYLNTYFKEQSVSILPLFSNINIDTIDEKKQFLSNTFNVILFGELHHDAPVENLLNWLQKELKTSQNNVYFSFIGNNGEHLLQWTNILDKHGVSYQSLSFQKESNIALLLQNSQLGITTTPYFLSDKSGTVAAMLRYQLPVLCVSRKWIPRVPKHILSEVKAISCTKWNNNLKLKKVLAHKPTVSSLKEVGDLFIKNLN